MTKKERRINERFIQAMDYADAMFDARIDDDGVFLIENFDVHVASCYGNVGEMIEVYGITKHIYKKITDVVRGDTSAWGEYFLTPKDVDPKFDEYEDIKLCYIRKSDIKEIWRKNYVVLKQGGVYSIRGNHWYGKKTFYKLRDLYNKKCFDSIVDGYSVRIVGMSNEELCSK